MSFPTSSTRTEPARGTEISRTSEDVTILVTSIQILRQSGGNLSETFETIATTWLGWVLIGAMLALQVAGALLMRRMVTIRV